MHAFNPAFVNVADGAVCAALFKAEFVYFSVFGDGGNGVTAETVEIDRFFSQKFSPITF